MSAEPSTPSASEVTEQDKATVAALFDKVGAEGIARIVEMRAEGKSSEEIAEALNAAQSAPEPAPHPSPEDGLRALLDTVHAFLEGDADGVPKAVFWAQLVEDYNCDPEQAAKHAGIELGPETLIELVLVRNYIEDFRAFSKWETWDCLSDAERQKEVEKYKAHGPEGRFIPEIRRRRKEKIQREIAERDASLKEGAA